MDQQYQPPHVPRYTDEDAQAYAMERLDKQLVSDTADVKFRDFWERRQSWALVALEEGHLNHWSWGRIVCIGDSVHKVGGQRNIPFIVLSVASQVTPESGQGANQAIESAAALGNHIQRMLHNCGEKLPDIAAVQMCLTAFEAKRQRRSKPVVEETNRHVRMFTFSNILFYFLGTYVQPIFRDITANISNYRHIGAERVEYLPVPPRSVSGIMAFNPTQGIGLFESSANRALLALPLLVVGLWSSGLAKKNLITTITQPAAVNGQLGVTNRSSAPTVGQVSTADSWSDPLSITASKLVDQYQLGWFFVGVAPVYLIWLMEANRRANYLKPIQLYVHTNPERTETEIVPY